MVNSRVRACASLPLLAKIARAKVSDMTNSRARTYELAKITRMQNCDMVNSCVCARAHVRVYHCWPNLNARNSRNDQFACAHAWNSFNYWAGHGPMAQMYNTALTLNHVHVFFFNKRVQKTYSKCQQPFLELWGSCKLRTRKQFLPTDINASFSRQWKLIFVTIMIEMCIAFYAHIRSIIWSEWKKLRVIFYCYSNCCVLIPELYKWRIRSHRSGS